MDSRELTIACAVAKAYREWDQAGKSAGPDPLEAMAGSEPGQLPLRRASALDADQECEHGTAPGDVTAQVPECNCWGHRARAAAAAHDRPLAALDARPATHRTRR